MAPTKAPTYQVTYQLCRTKTTRPAATAGKSCSGNDYTPRPRHPSMKKKSSGPLPARGHQGGDRRARSGLLSRLRQSAGLSRLDGALSERRGFCRPPRALPIWPARHAHHRSARIRAAGARRAAMRRRVAVAIGAGGDFVGAAGGGAFRRPYARYRQRLSADAKFLRAGSQAARRHHDLFRSAHRRAASPSCSSRTRGLFISNCRAR